MALTVMFVKSAPDHVEISIIIRAHAHTVTSAIRIGYTTDMIETQDWVHSILLRSNYGWGALGRMRPNSSEKRKGWWVEQETRLLSGNCAPRRAWIQKFIIICGNVSQFH